MSSRREGTSFTRRVRFSPPLLPSRLCTRVLNKPDLGARTEFYQLPEPVLRRALDVLVKAGKAQVFKGLGEDGDGVKFA